jgi:hypothetical protein
MNVMVFFSDERMDDLVKQGTDFLDKTGAEPVSSQIVEYSSVLAGQPNDSYLLSMIVAVPDSIVNGTLGKDTPPPPPKPQ